MANMSYCRFHNTDLDLRDCIDALEEYSCGCEEISDIEKVCAKNLYKHCKGYIEAYEMSDLAE